jgi:hypothetical protein
MINKILRFLAYPIRWFKLQVYKADLRSKINEIKADPKKMAKLEAYVSRKKREKYLGKRYKKATSK